MLVKMKPSDFFDGDSTEHKARDSRPTKAEADAIKWFNDCLVRAAKGPFAEIYRIDVAKAELLLGRNPMNRPMTGKRINDIASDILANLWDLNGETIVVSDEGLLNDGQTRLSAVVQTGGVIETFVVFGVKRRSRLTTDLGSARTVAHLLGMEGAGCTGTAAAVAAWLINYEKRVLLQDGRTYPTKAERTNKYWANADEIDDAIRFTSRKNSRELKANSALAVAYILISRKVGDEANVFFDKLCEGAGYDIGSPLHQTRARLKEMTVGRRQAGHKIAVIISGWNYWRTRRAKVRSIPVRDFYPEIED